MRGERLTVLFLGVGLAAACGGSSVRHLESSGGGGLGANDVGAATGGAGTAPNGDAGAAARDAAMSGGATKAGSGGATNAGSGGARTAATGGFAGDEVPGCGTTPLDQCDPGPDRLCNQAYCSSEEESLGFVDERGDGVLCKFYPDADGPDFACLQGEWCELDLPACRCGYHPGCQMGERCEPCHEAGCDRGEYTCQRAVVCTSDDLDTCGAEPGQTCGDGALTCTTSEACPTSPSDGSTRCDGAPGGCCAPQHWCFDGRECRCGAHPACAAPAACTLDAVGFYACLSPRD